MEQAADPDTARPIQGLSGAEAGEILGVTPLTVSQLVATGVLRKAVRYQHRGLDRGDVERLSLERWKPGRPYWVLETEAAQILRITRSWVFQLRQAGRLPFVEHGGRHFYRRSQLEVIANARESRRIS